VLSKGRPMTGCLPMDVSGAPLKRISQFVQKERVNDLERGKKINGGVVIGAMGKTFMKGS